MKSRREFTFVGISSSVLALVLGKVAQAESPAPEEAARVSALVRTALFVRDLDRASHFYRNVLGLRQIYGEGVLDSPAARQLLGLSESGSTRYRIVKAPGPNRGMVGLFELRDQQVPEATKNATRANYGEGCLVFYCEDLDVIVKAASQLKLPIVSAPVYLSIWEKNKGQREMTLRDPDGMLVNLIERSPEDPR